MNDPTDKTWFDRGKEFQLRLALTKARLSYWWVRAVDAPRLFVLKLKRKYYDWRISNAERRETILESRHFVEGDDE